MANARISGDRRRSARAGMNALDFMDTIDLFPEKERPDRPSTVLM
jgi:hypothetical protein